ncbi:sulfotransferase domain-containing protein [Alkalimarinus coralli]|nr:sulfotransferase domain-containing protein [Alkalimarinus coralli]
MDDVSNQNPQMNLAIVGGQKCGTTALANFIAQHPDIFVVNGKEGHIFDAPDIDSLSLADIQARYKLIMGGYKGERWVCDATPIYAYWQDIPARLVAYNPNIKVIFLTRDPVDRAVSHYFMEKNRGDETLSILRAFLSERKRLLNSRGDKGWESSWRHHSYLDRGRYNAQIENLKRSLATENILIMTNRELRHQQQQALARVFSFLGVNSIQVPEKDVFEGRYNTDKLAVKIARWYASFKLKHERKLFRSFEINR